MVKSRNTPDPAFYIVTESSAFGKICFLTISILKASNGFGEVYNY